MKEQSTERVAGSTPVMGGLGGLCPAGRAASAAAAVGRVAAFGHRVMKASLRRRPLNFTAAYAGAA